MDKLSKAILIILISGPLQAQVIPEMEFINRPVPDILMALADASGKTIITDETVKGSASYYFKQMEIQKALEVFLATQSCYHEERNGIVYVSRVRIETVPNTETYNIEAEDVLLQDIIRIFSRQAGITILYDALPREAVSIHLSGVTTGIFVETLLKRFSEYSFEETENYFYVKYTPPDSDRPREVQSGDFIQMSGDGLFSIALKQGRFKEVLYAFFNKTGKEVSILGRNDPVLKNLYFKDRTFDELLTLLMEQADCDYATAGELYYIVDIQKSDILKKLYSTVYLPVKYINVSDLPSLFPSGMVSSSSYKIDKNNNAIILFGSLAVISPIQDFIKKVDRKIEDREYVHFPLNYMEPEKIKSLLPSRFKNLEIIASDDINGIMAYVTEEQKRELKQIVSQLDNAPQGVPVQLKYIKAEQLLEHLPPSVSKNEISQTIDPTLIFFKGSEERLQTFLQELKEVDRPVPQIRYELLVVQVSENHSLQIGNNDDDGFNFGNIEDGDITSAIGNFGNIMSLSFDAISAFGTKFAFNLSSSLDTTQGRLMADTTLNGLSGEKISFQNTRTYRYQEIKEDDETSAEIKGDTQQITSGLFIDIDGWISGSGEITLEISATVSNQNDDTGGELPETSEKIVNTRIRTRSGEPVIIGGLMTNEYNKFTGRTPIAGDLPGLGMLFQKRNEKINEAEVIIYLIPFVEGEEFEPNSPAYFNRLYHRFIDEDTSE